MPQHRRIYLEALFCLCLLFAVPTLLLWPTITRGDLPFNLDGLTLQVPWQEMRETGVDSGNCAGEADLVQRYYPWYAFLNQARTEKELPLWNPYEGCGMPFLALWRTRALSIFSLPLYLLPLSAALGFSVFMKLSLAGLSAYYASRRFQFSPLFSLIMGITYQSTGILLVGHWKPISDLAPLFPLLLPGVQWLLLGRFRTWPSLALLLGIMLLSGSPDGLLAIVIFTLVLMLVYRLRTYQRAWLPGAVLTLVFSGVVAMGLAAIQVVPYIEFLGQGSWQESDAPMPGVWDLVSLLVSPGLGATNFETREATLWLPSCMAGFLLLPLWLSLRPFAARIRKRRVEAFLLAALVSLGIGIALTPWLRALPGLSFFDAHCFLVPLPLAFAFLAAAASDEWVHLSLEKCKKTLRLLAVLLPVFWLGSFGLMLLLMNYSPLPQAGSLVPALIFALTLFLLLAVTLVKPLPSMMAAILCCLVGAYSWHAYQPLSRYTPAQGAKPETHFIKSLMLENTRVAGSDKLQQWPLSIHGIAQVYAPSGIQLNRNRQFMQQAALKPELLRLTGANRLLLTKQDIQNRFSRLRPVLNIQEVFPSGAILLRDLQAHALAKVVFTGRPLEADKEAVLRVSGPPILESDYVPCETVEDSKGARAQITQSSFNHCTLKFEGSKPGILVLANSWYPGWQATTNGITTTLFPVDIAFQGAEIPEGSHEVLISYQPESVRKGGYVSLAALVVILVGYLYQVRASRSGARS